MGTKHSKILTVAFSLVISALVLDGYYFSEFNFQRLSEDGSVLFCSNTQYKDRDAEVCEGLSYIAIRQSPALCLDGNGEGTSVFKTIWRSKFYLPLRQYVIKDDGKYLCLKKVSSFDSFNEFSTSESKTVTATADQPVKVENFTVVAIPDTQFFARNIKGGVPEMWNSQFQWIRDNIETWNIKFITHLGDITDQLDGYDSNVQATEWDPAVAAFDLIHGHAPYGISPGNHDANNWNRDGIAQDDWSNYNRNFPVSRFADMPWYGGNFDENLNSYQFFTSSGMNFIVIHLKFRPTDYELTWARSVLEANAHRRAIIVSHEIQNRGIGGIGYFTGRGESIWNAVKSYNNVFMMLSGHHCGREAKQTLTNDHGKTVYSLMSNYQCDDPQPAYLRLYEFKPGENTIDVKTYSPWMDSYEKDSDSEFSLEYQMY